MHRLRTVRIYLPAGDLGGKRVGVITTRIVRVIVTQPHWQI